MWISNRFGLMRSKVVGTVASVLIGITILIGAFLIINRPELVKIAADVPHDFPRNTFSHDTFEELLRKYVNTEGQVDYEKWHASQTDLDTLDSYLAAVSAYSPETTPKRFARQSEALAYWLYAYNAYVIRSILEHWPLDSVTDVKAPIEAVTGFGFFYRQKFLFGEVAYSLYAVENDIIRKSYKDPRVHFVLNCASASCPVLKPELPTGDDLETLLHESTLEFVTDERNVFIDYDKKQVHVSTIFKWYEKDFLNELRRLGLPLDRGVIEYIATVAPEKLRVELAAVREFETTYVDYDWSINDIQ